jgi:TPR repeat protein
MRDRAFYILTFLLGTWPAFGLMGQPLSLLRTQADSGQIAACLEVSALYNLGVSGAPYRPDSGLYYLEKAASLGDADAAYLSAIHHLRGLGTPKNEPKGAKWLHRAAEKRHPDAVRTLFAAYSAQPLMFLEAQVQLKPDLPKALHFALLGATLGDAPSAHYAAMAYWQGRGTPRNDSLAIAYMHQAATTMAYAPAQQQLAHWYFRGLTAQGTQLDKAHLYYGMLAQNPKANIDQQTAGRVGQHECVQWQRISLNLPWLWAFPFPLMAPQLEVKP